MSDWLPAARSQVRIGDAERDQAVSALGEHFVAGRLTQEEFDERSDTATRARYAEDLLPLFDDLPGSAVQQPARAPRRRPGPPPLFVWLAPIAFALVAVSVILTAPWVLWLLFGLLLFRGPWRHRHWQGPPRWQHSGHYQYRR